jgi:hypothetical protein
MNVCPLDVLARTPDFESLASTLELRGWEWDFLHVVDGEATLGDVVRHLGIDIDSALGFVHEATHRGLLVVTTMSLQAYRLRGPRQTAIASSPRLYLNAAANAAPEAPAADPIVVAPANIAAPELAAAAPAPAPPAPPATPGKISFSSDAFDWTEPDIEELHDEPEPAVAAVAEPVVAVAEHVAADEAVAAPADHGAVHWDDRFGVEHPDGPFATVHPETEDAVDDPFAHAFVVDDSFAAVHPEAETVHAPEPVLVAEHEHEPIASASFADLMHDHDDDAITPFAPIAEHVIAPEHAVSDPFAPQAIPEPEPFVATPPATNGKSAHEQTLLAPFAIDSAEPHSNGEPVVEPPPRDTTPASISFSFSSDDPLDVVEPSEPRPAPQIPQPVFVPSDIVYHDERTPEAPKETAATAATQSTFYEREAIDTDASRELDAKTKNWKESLSWREQQELNEAAESGKAKAGVIGSLLRALGVR